MSFTGEKFDLKCAQKPFSSSNPFTLVKNGWYKLEIALITKYS